MDNVHHKDMHNIASRVDTLHKIKKTERNMYLNNNTERQGSEVPTNSHQKKPL